MAGLRGSARATWSTSHTCDTEQARLRKGTSIRVDAVMKQRAGRRKGDALVGVGPVATMYQVLSPGARDSALTVEGQSLSIEILYDFARADSGI